MLRICIPPCFIIISIYRKKTTVGAPAIKQVPKAVSRTKLQNDWLSDADELQ